MAEATNTPKVSSTELRDEPGRVEATAPAKASDAPSGRSALSVCPFCSCGCGLRLVTDEERLVAVAPSESDPVGRGRLCARGWSAHHGPGWGRRLTVPAVRRNGALVPASWSEAFGRVAHCLEAIGAAGGPIGVLGSARASNEENYLLARLARGALRTPNLDSCLRSTYLPLRLGVADVAGRGRVRATFEDVERSDFVLLVEGDLARSHPRLAAGVLKAVRAGCTLVTVGPRRTQMSRLAALHLACRPGGESALLGDLTAAALATGKVDTLPSRHQIEGLEQLRTSLLEAAPGEERRRVARWCASAERASFVLAPSCLVAGGAERLAAALTTFAAVTGHLERSDSPVVVPPARWNLRGACEVGVVPDLLPDLAPLGDARTAERLRAVWGCEPVRDVGLDAASMLEEVAALIVLADDPPAVLADSAAARAALARVDCLVVLDAFVTPATELAEVVLPIASFAESDGSSTNAEGRVQPLRAALAPPGEARPGWQVLAELAALLGMPAAHRSLADVTGEIAYAVPSYTGATPERLADGPGVMTPGPALHHGLKLTATAHPAAEAEDGATQLAWDSTFDWSSDPLVAASPILSRDGASLRKLNPNGVVELSRGDADRLGVRQGWPVRLVSAHGEIVLPAALRQDLESGVAQVPFALREKAAVLMGGDAVVQVRIERT